ncbi:MAG: phosphoglucosamine mutase, partial [Cyanothece sp. SIO1E1]|nr:phosphoglucosamine mutase [Cyanothece sp. SIO1E1]
MMTSSATTKTLELQKFAVHTKVPVSLPGVGWEPISALPSSPLFGTDGIRGHVGDLLSAPLVLQIGFWAGRILSADGVKPGPIIIGQDSRNSSHMLAMALSAGLTSAGLEVWNLGLCPTASVAYLTSVSEAIGGVMISASHNPPADNGIKFFSPDGTKLATHVQQQIEAALRGQSTDQNWMSSCARSGWGQHYHRPDLVERYLASLRQTLDASLCLSGMRIVLDLAWGSAAQVAPALFKALGADVICLHDLPDGDRINVNCGSTHLGPLQAAIKQHGADLGFAFDGDADRVMAIDGQGRVVDGDYILYLWGTTLSRAQQLPDNTIISTVMANLGFERAWEKFGGKLIRTAVGDQHVHAEMLKRGAMLGGEQSGHILCRHYSVTGDGILTALHLATLVSQVGESLSELIDQSFQTYPQLLRNVRVENRDRRLNWQNCDG